MTIEFAVLVDYAVTAFILLALIGGRFNRWPETEHTLFTGRPSEYINFPRYVFFYLAYVLTFVFGMLAVGNLRLVLPGSNLPQPFQDLVANLARTLGNNSWTVPALYLLAVVNETHVARWDALWRGRLQTWARIPQEVEELKKALLFDDNAVVPDPERLEAIRGVMKRLGVATYWDPVIDRWQQEKAAFSLDWTYLKTLYLLRLCRELRVDAINAGDLERQEKRLHDLGRILPNIDRESENVAEYRQELDDLYAYLIEGLCKYLVRRNPSPITRRDALHNLGFRTEFHDTQELQVSVATVRGLLGVLVACIAIVGVYLQALDLVGIPGPRGGPWLTPGRLAQWCTGSVLSYAIAVFTPIVLEKVLAERQTEPGPATYFLAVLLSTLGSLTYFRIASMPSSWPAFTSLALSLGVIAIVVIRALTKSTCLTKRETWLSASRHGLLIGCLGCVLQLLALYFFARNSQSAAALPIPMLLLTAGYGFVKGAVVGFIVSFSIQESIRRQLAVALRKCPRGRLRMRVPMTVDGTRLGAATRNISKDGLMIEATQPLEPGQEVVLEFEFGPVPATVQWASNRFAGVAFNGEDPVREGLNRFIRKRLGLGYA